MALNQQTLQNKIFSLGKKHWIVQRLTAILLIFTLPTLIYKFVYLTKITSFDIYNCTNLIIFSKWTLTPINLFVDSFLINLKFFDINLWKNLYIVFIFSVILLHMFSGLENIILDYIHNIKIKKLIILFIKSIQILLLKFLFLDIFCG
jgi:succinate dehydrogenase hydrophobic anchor subunit